MSGLRYTGPFLWLAVCAFILRQQRQTLLTEALGRPALLLAVELVGFGSTLDVEIPFGLVQLISPMRRRLRQPLFPNLA